MKTSEKLYNLNTQLSIIYAKQESIEPYRVGKLNKALSEIIKEIRRLEGET